MSGHTAIARRKRRAYALRMPGLRFLRFLIILALLAGPTTMSASSAQATVHAMAERASESHVRHNGSGAGALDHCAERDAETGGQPAPSADCMTACAAIPAASGELELLRTEPESAGPAARESIATGLNPEAATPPPRIS